MTASRERATLEPVCTALAAILDDYRRQVEASLVQMQASRETGMTQTTYVHTSAGPVRLAWPSHAPRVIATLFMPSAGGTNGKSPPSFVGRSLMLGLETFAGMPHTVMAALPGRLLGEVARTEDPFIATMSTTRMERVVEHGDHVEVVLDVGMTHWS